MEKLLNIEPQELSFPYELSKQVSCSIRLYNRTRNHVAFKVMTTNPKKYSVLPNLGIVLPGSSCDLTVTMLGPKANPPEGQCKDKFLIRSIIASPGATTRDNIMKLNGAGGHIQECKLGVAYTFPREYTNLNDPKMSARKLLGVHPLELQFPFELKKELSCSLQLSNMTANHILFKVKTTDPKKYCVQPNIGIVLPRSTCDVIVRMQPQKKIPEDMQCKDKFLIQSIVGSPAATTKKVTPEMFDKPTGFIEELKLRVVYAFPSTRLQDQNSNDPEVVTEKLGRNETSVCHLLMKGIYLAVLGLFSCYLIMKILPFIWSLIFLIVMLVVKIITNLASNSLEDWILKIITCVCIHVFNVLFGRYL